VRECAGGAWEDDSERSGGEVVTKVWMCVAVCCRVLQGVAV